MGETREYELNVLVFEESFGELDAEEFLEYKQAQLLKTCSLAMAERYHGFGMTFEDDAERERLIRTIELIREDVDTVTEACVHMSRFPGETFSFIGPKHPDLLVYLAYICASSEFPDDTLWGYVDRLIRRAVPPTEAVEEAAEAARKFGEEAEGAEDQQETEQEYLSDVEESTVIEALVSLVNNGIDRIAALEEANANKRLGYLEGSRNVPQLLFDKLDKRLAIVEGAIAGRADNSPSNDQVPEHA